MSQPKNPRASLKRLRKRANGRQRSRIRRGWFSGNDSCLFALIRGRALVRDSGRAQTTCLALCKSGNLPDMFTGIVEETGIVRAIKPSARSIALTIEARRCAAGLKRGDSVAVNGCCLTAVKLTPRGRARLVQFDLLRETWGRTNLQHTRPGSLVNLERPLRADGRLGGHFVTGHVDGVGKILRWERVGRDLVLEISAPAPILRYVVLKGSIAVDGISLTVAGATRRSFHIWIIPHTYEVTALRDRNVGDLVNLEADILGKHVERLLSKP